MYNLRRFPHVDGLKAIAHERPSPEYLYLAGREFRNDRNGRRQKGLFLLEGIRELHEKKHGVKTQQPVAQTQLNI